MGRDDERHLREARADEFFKIRDLMDEVLSDTLGMDNEDDVDDIVSATEADLAKMTYGPGSMDIRGPIEGVSWQVSRANRWWHRRLDQLHGRELEGVTPEAWVRNQIVRWHPDDDQRDEELVEREAEFVRAVATEWSPVAPAINVWLDTIYKRCIRFFEKHPGIHPKMTSETYAARQYDQTAIWRPPVHDDERRIRASSERFEELRRRVFVAYNEKGLTVPEFVERYAELV